MAQKEDLIKLFNEIAELLEIQGVAFKPAAYRRAVHGLENFNGNISQLYQEEGKKALRRIPGVGESIAQKIEEYIKKKNAIFRQRMREKNVWTPKSVKDNA